MSDVKVTDQCVEMRNVISARLPSKIRLQYRSLRICVDASGALCPNGYTDWIDVDTVWETHAAIRPTESGKGE